MMSEAVAGGGGYVPLPRWMVDHGVIQSMEEFGAVAWMLSRAAWRDEVVAWRSRAIRLTRGVALVSARGLSARLGWSDGRVRRFLRRLQIAGILRVTCVEGAPAVAFSMPSGTAAQSGADASCEATRTSEATRRRRTDDADPDAYDRPLKKGNPPVSASVCPQGDAQTERETTRRRRTDDAQTDTPKPLEKQGGIAARDAQTTHTCTQNRRTDDADSKNQEAIRAKHAAEPVSQHVQEIGREFLRTAGVDIGKHEVAGRTYREVAVWLAQGYTRAEIMEAARRRRAHIAAAGSPMAYAARLMPEEVSRIRAEAKAESEAIEFEYMSPSDRDWLSRLEMWKARKFWLPELWGPPPGDRDCNVPRMLIRRVLGDDAA